MAGGYFDAAPNGGSYFCILPDGQVILCDTGRRTCVVIEATAPELDQYWTPPNSDGLQVQGGPGPVRDFVSVTADVRAVHLVQPTW